MGTRRLFSDGSSVDRCARAFVFLSVEGKAVLVVVPQPLPSEQGECSMAFDLYTEITNQIAAMLDKCVVPWRSPILGRGTAGHPKNLESTKPYRGINIFLLAFTAFAKGYGSAYWLTFNQAKAKGGAVKKGEKSSMVVFWKQFETTDKDSGETKTVPVL